MPENTDAHPVAARPRQLLTQNRELKAIGVWNWTLPAWAGRLDDGRTFNTCPSAGICAKVCYASNAATSVTDFLAFRRGGGLRRAAFVARLSTHRKHKQLARGGHRGASSDVVRGIM
jgi:hypothetical protein